MMPSKKRRLFSSIGAFASYLFDSSGLANDGDVSQHELVDCYTEPSSNSGIDDHNSISQQFCDAIYSSIDSNNSIMGNAAAIDPEDTRQDGENFELLDCNKELSTKPFIVKLQKLEFAFEPPKPRKLVIRDNNLAFLQPTDSDQEPSQDSEDEQERSEQQEIDDDEEGQLPNEENWSGVESFSRVLDCSTDDESSLFGSDIYDHAKRIKSNAQVDLDTGVCSSKNLSDDDFVSSSTPLKSTIPNDNSNQSDEHLQSNRDTTSESNISKTSNDQNKLTEIIEKQPEGNDEQRPQNLGKFLDKSEVRIVRGDVTLTWAEFEKQFGFGDVKILTIRPDGTPASDRNNNHCKRGNAGNSQSDIDQTKSDDQLGAGPSQTTADFLEAITTLPADYQIKAGCNQRSTLAYSLHKITKDAFHDADEVVKQSSKFTAEPILPEEIVCKVGSGRGPSAKYQVRLSDGRLEIWSSTDIRKLAPPVFKEYQRKLAVDQSRRSRIRTGRKK